MSTPASAPAAFDVFDAAVAVRSATWLRERHARREGLPVVPQGRRVREGVALLRARLTRPGPAAVTLERVFWFDPYAVETVLEDGLASPAGTHVEVQLDAGTPNTVVDGVQARLASLTRRGITVDVRRRP